MYVDIPDHDLGGDIEKSRGVADDVKIFIEKHPDKSDDKTFKQVALMKIKDMHAHDAFFREPKMVLDIKASV